MIKRIARCKNIFKKSSTVKVSEHFPCGYSMSLIWTFDSIKNKYSVYRSKDYIKSFSESLSELVMMIINFEKKKIIALTNEQEDRIKSIYICKKRVAKKVS